MRRVKFDLDISWRFFEKVRRTKLVLLVALYFYTAKIAILISRKKLLALSKALLKASNLLLVRIASKNVLPSKYFYLRILTKNFCAKQEFLVRLVF